MKRQSDQLAARKPPTPAPEKEPTPDVDTEEDLLQQTDDAKVVYSDSGNVTLY